MRHHRTPKGVLCFYRDVFLQANADRAPGVEASWSRYWAVGHEHSCPTSFDGFYGPGLQAFWKRQCTGLGAGDLVLDLGCGNGGLLRFLHAQFAPGQAPQLRGVDAAALRPPSFLDTPNIMIHERTPFHALPLESASVSLAVSQFGIEYGNSDETWQELFRVLRPSARVAFVAHKQGSHLDRVAADELVIGRAALDSELFVRALALTPYLRRAQSDAERAALRRDRAAEAARMKFNAAVESLGGVAGLLRHGAYAQDILETLTQVLGSASSGAGTGVADRVEAMQQGLRDHLVRLNALRASALDETALQRIRRRLLTAGFELADAAIIAERDAEMGWTIEGQR